MQRRGLSYNRNTDRRKDWPGFLNSTGRLSRRQRTVRFPVGTETTEAELTAALGSLKVLP